MGTEVEGARTNIPARSLLVNGGFELWQRGASFHIEDDRAFTADEWEAQAVGLDDIDVMQHGSGPQLVGASSLRVIFHDAARPPGGPAHIRQGIELYRSLGGQWVTFSCVVAPLSSRTRIGIADFDGAAEETLSGFAPAGSVTRLAVARKVRSGLLPNPDWPHSYGLTVFIEVTGGEDVAVDGAMLVMGESRDGVTCVPLHPADKWARCQRHFEKQEQAVQVGHYMRHTLDDVNFGLYHERIDFQARKAAVPTVTLSNITYPDTPRNEGGNAGTTLQLAGLDGFIWRILDDPSGNDYRTFNRTSFEWSAEVA